MAGAKSPESMGIDPIQFDMAGYEDPATQSPLMGQVQAGMTIKSTHSGLGFADDTDVSWDR